MNEDDTVLISLQKQLADLCEDLIRLKADNNIKNLPWDSTIETKEVYAALVRAQAKFNAAVKHSANPAFRSKYADLSACFDAIKGALEQEKLGIMQFAKTGEDFVHVRTQIIHESGQWILSEGLRMPVAKSNAHGIAGGMTYAKRYDLVAMMGLTFADYDDDGNAASGQAEYYDSSNPKHRNRLVSVLEKVEEIEKERYAKLSDYMHGRHWLILDDCILKIKNQAAEEKKRLLAEQARLEEVKKNAKNDEKNTAEEHADEQSYNPFP